VGRSRSGMVFISYFDINESRWVFLRHRQLPRRQRRLLAAIDCDLGQDDPGLTSMFKAFELITAGQQMPVHGRVAVRPRWSQMLEMTLDWLAAAQWEPLTAGAMAEAEDSDPGDSGMGLA
jgi:hypothetical protein